MDLMSMVRETIVVVIKIVIKMQDWRRKSEYIKESAGLISEKIEEQHFLYKKNTAQCPKTRYTDFNNCDISTEQ